MNEISKLIKLNLEMEGLLRTIQSRDSEQVSELLLEKAKEYLAGVEAMSGEKTLEIANEQDAVFSAIRKAKTEPEELGEVKEEEAEDAEITPEGELADAAIAAGERKSVVINEKLVKSFTLNDRFRFRRELFNGDDEDFSATLQLLSEMDSYSEAEDYLLNDMMWDKNNPAVADFLSILSANM